MVYSDHPGSNPAQVCNVFIVASKNENKQKEADNGQQKRPPKLGRLYLKRSILIWETVDGQQFPFFEFDQNLLNEIPAKKRGICFYTFIV